MRLEVSHVTTYRFGSPMRGLVQSHRLTPIVHEGQQVLDWRIGIPSEAVRGSELRDGAGNLIQTITVRGPVSEVTIDVSGTVETIDTTGVLRNHRESVPPLAYLRATRATRADLALTELAQEAVSGIDAALDRAHALTNSVADNIAYVPGRTHQATTAAEALATGEGVCQDHAHALISAASAVGIPGRYVTGYLWSAGEGGQDQVQSLAASGEPSATDQAQQQQQTEHGPAGPASPEASHAWAELFVEGLGWVGFDASNRCCPDEKYIRLGSGLDAAEAAPIRGVAQGVGEEWMEIHVAVRRLDG